MRLKTVPWLLTAALTIGVLAQASDGMKSFGRTSTPSTGSAYRDGEVIVVFSKAVEFQEVERTLRAGGAVHARSGQIARLAQRYLVTLEAGMAVPEAVEQFNRMAGVDYAEPNGIVRKSQGSTFTPNDPFFEFQWNMTLVGAQRTWAIQKGQNSVGVAVLDTGVAYEDYVDPVSGQVFGKAPDWGSTTFLPGWDAVNEDSHPNDDEWHGTHVSSTIAEGTNNSFGLAGLAFNCSLMPVKVLDEFGEGTFFDVAEGIDYAASYEQGGQRPVKVINMSFGADGFSETVARSLDRAYQNGVVLVAAAGNSGREGIDFPARQPNVIAAGAVDARGERAPYSSTGAELDLMAPGGNCSRDDDADGEADCVFQQMPDPDSVVQGIHTDFCLCGLDGTSMASPHIAAAAALLISQGITDPDSVRAALEQTADGQGGADERTDLEGYGLIQPAAALSGLGFNQGPVD
jgi:serine protease